MKLTDVACRNAKPGDRPRKLSDGLGLFLLIQPAGGKLWRFSYRYLGKQKTLALGVYPAINLKDARQSRDHARELLAKGIDPGEHKKSERRQKSLAHANSFETVAREWFNARLPGWTPGYSDRILRRIDQDIFPTVGKRPIGEIEPPEMLAVIRQVEARGPDVECEKEWPMRRLHELGGDQTHLMSERLYLPGNPLRASARFHPHDSRRCSPKELQQRIASKPNLLDRHAVVSEAHDVEDVLTDINRPRQCAAHCVVAL